MLDSSYLANSLGAPSQSATMNRVLSQTWEKNDPLTAVPQLP